MDGTTEGLPLCASIPFGAGPRYCPGANLAFVDLALTTAARDLAVTQGSYLVGRPGPASSGFLPSDRLAELDEKVLGAYLDGLHAAGWRGTVIPIRIAHDVTAALRFGLD